MHGLVPLRTLAWSPKLDTWNFGGKESKNRIENCTHCTQSLSHAADDAAGLPFMPTDYEAGDNSWDSQQSVTLCNLQGTSGSAVWDTEERVARRTRPALAGHLRKHTADDAAGLPFMPADYEAGDNSFYGT